MPAKVAVITGGASGIGRAAALAFARHGTKVIIGDIDLNGAKDAVASSGFAVLPTTSRPQQPDWLL